MQLLSFSGLARSLPTICEKSWQRTSNSDSRQKKDVLKNILFSNYFMLAIFILLIKFSKIVFAVWNFVLSLRFYYRNKFCPSCMLSKWIESDFSTLHWIAESEKIRYVYSREIFLSAASIREVNSTEIDSHFTASERQDYAPLRHQATNNQTNFHNFQNTQLNLLTVTFLAILRWTEINLRWLIIDGCVKEGKRLTITVNF